MGKKFSDEWFLNLYLKYGSVEEAISRHDEPLPISAANFHRLVNKYGLIVSAGRHVSLPETLHFFREKAFAPGTPLEKLYKQMPLNFKTSLTTLHRIYQLVEKSAVRRFGVALVITAESDSRQILIGQEATENSRYGKSVGDVSIPMGFSRPTESQKCSVLRVLQQEVFSSLASQGNLDLNSPLTKILIQKGLAPFAYFDIVDVRVSVYKILLPKLLEAHFKSHKLNNHKFVDLKDINKLKTRVGIGEILGIYEQYLYSSSGRQNTAHHVSSLNLSLALASG